MFWRYYWRGLGFFLVKTKNKGLVNVSLLQGQPQNLHQPTNLSNEGECWVLHRIPVQKNPSKPKTRAGPRLENRMLPWHYYRYNWKAGNRSPGLGRQTRKTRKQLMAYLFLAVGLNYHLKNPCGSLHPLLPCDHQVWNGSSYGQRSDQWSRRNRLSCKEWSLTSLQIRDSSIYLHLVAGKTYRILVPRPCAKWQKYDARNTPRSWILRIVINLNQSSRSWFVPISNEDSGGWRSISNIHYSRAEYLHRWRSIRD